MHAMLALSLVLSAQAPETAAAPEAEEVIAPEAEVEPEVEAPAPVVEEEQRALRVAVADIDAADIEDKLKVVFLDSLLAELRKLDRVSVIGMDEVRAMLDMEAQKQAIGCGEEESCLAEIAGALGADVMVIGGIAKVGEEKIVSLKRVEQREAKVSQQYSQRLKDIGGEELLAAIGPSVEALFPDRELRAGMERGVAPELALRLNPPPLPPWAFWTTVGVAGGATALSGITALWWGAAQADYSDFVAGATEPGGVDGAEVVKREGNLVAAEVTTWTLLGIGVVAGAAAAASVPLVDWQGHDVE
jgi:hypothetical protein